MNVVSCKNCETAHPHHCPRCEYLINNMRRWRKVAEQLHEQVCTHPARQRPTSCSSLIEGMYNKLLKAEQ